jgi:hypothetical protein
MGELGNPHISVMNVDDSDLATNAFLKKIGFQIFIRKYETHLPL